MGTQKKTKRKRFNKAALFLALLLAVGVGFPQAPARAAEALGADEMNASSYDTLKAVLTEASFNNISTIYLTGNIIVPSGTTRAIHRDHVSNITIVGHPKGDDDIRYTIQDYPGSYFRPSKDGLDVTLKDLNIRGYSYFGIIGTYGYTYDLTLKFDNVDYIGSQPVYNMYGETTFIDTNITIAEVPADAAFTKPALAQNPREQVAETQRLIFGGTCSFTKSQDNFSMFWLGSTGNKYVQVLPGSDISIINDSSSVTLYGNAFRIDGPTSAEPPLTIGKGASLSIDVWDNVLIDSPTNYFQSVEVADGASLRIIQRGNQAITGPTLDIRNSLYVGKGGVLEVSRPASTRTDGLINIRSANGFVNFNKPERIRLYNPAKRLLTATSGPLYIEGSVGAINVWATSATDEDSIRNFPTYTWNKQNGADLLFAAATGTGSSASATASASILNLDTADFAANPFDPSAFTVNNMAMLTMGRYSLAIDPIYEPNTVITGKIGTADDATGTVITSYRGKDGASRSLNASVRSDGSWAAHIPEPDIPIKSGVGVLAIGYSNYLLFYHKAIVAPDPGRLSFLDVPGQLAFARTTPPAVTTLAPRVDTDWSIAVSDTRIDTQDGRQPWDLTASIASPLTGLLDGTPYTLDNALVFVNTEGQATPLGSSPLLIQRGQTDNGDRTAVKWPANRGLLLRVLPGQVKAGVHYETTIQWNLTDAP
jgi:hypothetical protein